MARIICVECRQRTPLVSGGRKCGQCLEVNEARYKAARREAAIRPRVHRQVWIEAAGRCEYCGVACHPKRDRYDSADSVGEVDHVVPAALGGTGQRENLKLSCKGCNRRREAELRSAVRLHIDEKKRHVA